MESESASIVKLTGAENWSMWKFQVRVILNANNAWEVVDGTLTKPLLVDGGNAEDFKANQTALAVWKKTDNVAQKVIATSVGEVPLIHILNSENARDMWIKLLSVYEHRSETGIHILQQQWYSSTKEKNDNMATHIAKMTNLAHRLKVLGEPVSDSMIATKILMTLPRSYNHFVSAWDSTSTSDRTLANLTTRLIIEESRTVSQEKLEDNKAFFSKNWRENNKRKEKYSSKKKDKTKPGKCYFCEKPGHWARECPDRKQEKWNKEHPKTKGDALVGTLMTASNEIKYNGKWYLDSGASDHMSYNRDWFINLVEFDQEIPVQIGDGKYISALGRGDINILAFNGKCWSEKHLANVLYVPKIKYNLFSVGSALDKGLELQSTESTCKLTKEGVTVLVGVRQHKLYVLTLKVLTEKGQIEANQMEANLIQRDSLQVWHERMVHQNTRHVKNVLKKSGIKPSDTQDFFCEGCAFGKMHREPFPRKVSNSTRIGELIHADVCGKMQKDSIGGSRYFVLFKDDFSHMKSVYFIIEKSETKDCIRNFLLKTEKHVSQGVKILRTDNGLEFINKEVQELTQNMGIIHQRTVPYSPEQNGIAERENRTIVEAARTLLYATGLGLDLWAEAVNTAVTVLNWTGTSTIEGTSPYKLWHKKEPDLSKLRKFGEVTFVHVPDQKRKKFDAKAERGIFVGYDNCAKGYRIWFENKNVVKVCRDVKFTGQIQEPKKKTCKEDKYVIVELLNQNHQKVPTQHEENNELNESNEHESQPVLENNRYNLRNRDLLKNTERYDEYAMNMNLMAESAEPLNYQSAINSNEANKWRRAMDEEIQSLRSNQTWDLVSPPENQDVIDNKWTFKVKRNADRSIQRYKARLVARGFRQQPGIDFKEIFSPVVRFNSIRAILAVVASRNMKIKQFDVKTAFLYGELEETIFMTQPEGYEDGTNNVCKLKRSIYGLKQAARCWNKRFTVFLKKHRLKATDADPCVFTRDEKGKRVILAIYIDDELVAADEEEQIQELLQELKTEFDITVDEVDLFLDLQIERLPDGSIFLHQESYAKRILDLYRMQDANPVAIPADCHHEMCQSVHLNEKVKPTAPYRQAIGSLMYLSVATRLDITFAVHSASQYSQDPRNIHWNAVKRILKYVKGTINHGLLFKRDQNIQLVAFSDADYAGELQTRRSTTGYALKLGSSLISWNSEKQNVVALSTTEAEYMAACQCVKEIVWTKRLLKNLTNNSDVPTTLHIDNQSAIRLIKNPEFHKRSKHIDVRFHFIREKYEQGEFTLEYIASENQEADILTKPLAKQSSENQRRMLGIKDRSSIYTE